MRVIVRHKQLLLSSPLLSPTTYYLMQFSVLLKPFQWL
jgi:hypothetical protein